MAEYIEREAALEIINELDREPALFAGAKIYNLPAADVVPVVHGHWMDDKYVWRCSNCHKWLEVTQGDGRMCYCPNCGAKMVPVEDRGGEL